VRVETGAAEDDVVGLPLARRAAGVHERRELAVERRRLAVGIGCAPVRVQALDLVAAREEAAAVAAVLALSRRRRRRAPLDVQLDIAEARRRAEGARTGHDFQRAIDDAPPRRRSEVRPGT